MEFLPDGGHAVPTESGETMSRRPRRNHAPGFKAKVVLAAIKGDRTLAELAEQEASRSRLQPLSLTCPAKAESSSDKNLV